MARITWSPDAGFDLERVLRRIAREASVRSAEKWAAKLRAAVAMLETFPEIGSPVEDEVFVGLREQLVGAFRVIHRYDGAECRILTIARAEQDLRRVLDPDNLP